MLFDQTGIRVVQIIVGGRLRSAIQALAVAGCLDKRVGLQEAAQGRIVDASAHLNDAETIDLPWPV